MGRLSDDGQALDVLGAASPAVLAHAVDQSTSAVLITDARLEGDGPLIVYANPAFCRMSGYPPEQLLGRSPRLLLPPLRRSLPGAFPPAKGASVSTHKARK